MGSEVTGFEKEKKTTSKLKNMKLDSFNKG